MDLKVYIGILIFLLAACSAGKQMNDLKIQSVANPDLTGISLTNETDLDTLLSAVGDAPVVLLGEASHGTSEFFKWRAEFTKQLITKKGFTAVAIEADWNDTYSLNALIGNDLGNDQQLKEHLLHQFRWPQWLWTNEEFLAFLKWIRDNNERQNVRLYGLDVFSFEEALDSLITAAPDKTLLSFALNAKQCLKPYQKNAMEYQKAVKRGIGDCSAVVDRLWVAANSAWKMAKDERSFLMLQNARVVFNGERYFRGTVYNRGGAWNIRDRHMEETVSSIMKFYGRGTKIVVWAHNSHVGDAAFTDMPGRGRSNLGQMLRKEFGPTNVFIVGFGTYTGSVIAAPAWDSSYKVLQLPAARQGSVEELLHRNGVSNSIFLSRKNSPDSPLNKWLWHRAVGVVELPVNGQFGSYVNSLISKRYDAFIYLDRTTAITPLQ